MADAEPRTKAVEHFAETGVILPGAAAEVARFLQERREQHR